MARARWVIPSFYLIFFLFAPKAHAIVPQNVFVAAALDGGATTYSNVNLSSTGVSIKGSVGQIYGWYIVNTSTSLRYVKLYDKATAPSVGTDTPRLRLAIPANGTANLGAGANAMGVPGVAFQNGIGVGATQLPADSDTTAPATNDVIFNLFYK